MDDDPGSVPKMIEIRAARCRRAVVIAGRLKTDD